MKIKFTTCLFFIFLLSACSFLGPGSENGEPDKSDLNPQSQQICGDQICDGPENASSCPHDCAVNPAESHPEPADESVEDSPNQDVVSGEVYLDLKVSRTNGVGTCGDPPWGVDHVAGGDFSCVPPKYWFGYELVATAFQRVEITETGSGTWAISGVGTGGGTYQTASHWSDGQRVCEPVEILAEPFDLKVSGTVRGGKIALKLDALPLETSKWDCNTGSGYERETTLLYLNSAIAMTGVYNSLSCTLGPEHRPSDGFYSQTYTAEMNPSPENRDFAEVKVEFSCTVSGGEGIETSAACPWEE